MKRLTLAVAAMLAAMLFAGNASAVSLSPASGVHAKGSAVMVHCGRVHRCHHHRTCGGCGCRLYSYSTGCTACGGCGGCGGCGAAYYGPQIGCGCGHYSGGWSVFGWLF